MEKILLRFLISESMEATLSAIQDTREMNEFFRYDYLIKCEEYDIWWDYNGERVKGCALFCSCSIFCQTKCQVAVVVLLYCGLVWARFDEYPQKIFKNQISFPVRLSKWNHQLVLKYVKLIFTTHQWFSIKNTRQKFISVLRRPFIFEKFRVFWTNSHAFYMMY